MFTKWIHIPESDSRFTINFIKQLLDEKKTVYVTKYSFGSDKVLAAVKYNGLDWVAVPKKHRMLLQWYNSISYRDWFWK